MAKTYKNFRKNKKHISKRRNNKKAKRSTYKKKKIVGGMLEVCSDPNQLKGCEIGVYDTIASVIKRQEEILEGLKKGNNPDYDSSFSDELQEIIDNVQTQMEKNNEPLTEVKEKANLLVSSQLKEYILNNKTNKLFENMSNTALKIIQQNGPIDHEEIDNIGSRVFNTIKPLFKNDKEIYPYLNKIELKQFVNIIEDVINTQTKPHWKPHRTVKTGGGIIFIAALAAGGVAVDPTGVIITIVVIVVVSVAIYYGVKKYNKYRYRNKVEVYPYQYIKFDTSKYYSGAEYDKVIDNRYYVRTPETLKFYGRFVSKENPGYRMYPNFGNFIEDPESVIWFKNTDTNDGKQKGLDAMDPYFEKYCFTEVTQANPHVPIPTELIPAQPSISATVPPAPAPAITNNASIPSIGVFSKPVQTPHVEVFSAEYLQKNECYSYIKEDKRIHNGDPFLTDPNTLTYIGRYISSEPRVHGEGDGMQHEFILDGRANSVIDNIDNCHYFFQTNCTLNDDNSEAARFIRQQTKQ